MGRQYSPYLTEKEKEKATRFNLILLPFILLLAYLIPYYYQKKCDSFKFNIKSNEVALIQIKTKYGLSIIKDRYEIKDIILSLDKKSCDYVEKKGFKKAVLIIILKTGEKQSYTLLYSNKNNMVIIKINIFFLEKDIQVPKLYNTLKKYDI